MVSAAYVRMAWLEDKNLDNNSTNSKQGNKPTKVD
jgi:hypothetical protein